MNLIDNLQIDQYPTGFLRHLSGTRLRWKGFTLVNMAESVDWEDTPVKTIVCETCGESHCTDGGYVQISRLGEYILWTEPLEDFGGDVGWHCCGTLEVIEKMGALLFPIQLWRDLLPPWMQEITFPATRRIDIASAWLLTTIEYKPTGAPLKFLSTSKDRSYYFSPQDFDVRAEMEKLAAWVLAAPDAPVDGELRLATEIGARIIFIPAQGSFGSVWPALAWVDNEITFSFQGDWVLQVPKGTYA